MKFKIDENFPVEFAELLRQAGIEADTVEGEGLSGAAVDAAYSSRSILTVHSRRNTTDGFIVPRTKQ